MKDYTLNLIINLLLMIFAVYSIKELIYDNSLSGKFYKKIKKEGWVLIVLAILCISFNFIRDKRSEMKQDQINSEKANVDSLLQSTQFELKDLQIKTKDTILNMVERTYIKSIEATNKALADYNLEITDSLTNVINQLEINALNPQLIIAPLDKNSPFAYLNDENGEEELNIKFNSVEGTSYNINLKYYFIDQQGYGKIYKSGTLTIGNEFLTQNITRTYSIVVTDKNLKNFDNLLVLIKGSFTKDPEGQIVIPYNSAFNFNFKENKLIRKMQVDYEELKNRLKIK
jgi:hypothetical protein